MPKTTSSQERKICQAALGLAATRGWEHVTLEQVAKAAKIPVPTLKARHATVSALLPLIVEFISDETFSACEQPEKNSPPQDRLFDVLMARFDRLQQSRQAIISIAAAVGRHPRAAASLIPAQIEAMRRTFDYCGLTSSMACSKLSPLALWGVLLAAFRVWKNDETLDMSKTMAALDRYLRYAVRAATLLPVDFI